MKIFTYGSLKRGEPNHNILKDINAKFLGDAITSEKYPLFEIIDPFPYLQNEPGIGHFIKGEAYEVPDDKKPYLDYFEGAPDLYNLGKIMINLNKNITELDVYFKTNSVSLDNLKFLKEWSFFN